MAMSPYFFLAVVTYSNVCKLKILVHNCVQLHLIFSYGFVYVQMVHKIKRWVEG